VPPLNPAVPPVRKVGVFLIDPSLKALATLQTCIEQHPEWELLGHARTVRDALFYSALTRADVYLVGLDLPDGSGNLVLEYLKNSVPHSRRLVFVASLDTATWMLSSAHGATGFALKNTSPEELRRSIEETHPEKRPPAPDGCVEIPFSSS
jgi:HlyD family secretion protein